MQRKLSGFTKRWPRWNYHKEAIWVYAAQCLGYGREQLMAWARGDKERRAIEAAWRWLHRRREERALDEEWQLLLDEEWQLTKLLRDTSPEGCFRLRIPCLCAEETRGEKIFLPQHQQISGNSGAKMSR
jgi:hypothetical protein